MKIPLSIRDAYGSQFDLNQALGKIVDETIRHLKPPRWHYESRIKGLESFAVKIESGRVKDPRALEGFFACTLVVPNSIAIAEAEVIIGGSFEVRYRRPKSVEETSKQAVAFPFDDLRLYCRLRNAGELPERPVDRLVFEIQIKTFLQHAWSIATHDLTYKTDEVRWSKDRIAAHIKAMVEHAELSIQEATSLACSPLLSKTDEVTRLLAETIEVLKVHWARSDLPENIRGLALAVQQILSGLRLRPTDLNAILDAEKVSLGGSFDLNLSPYGVIVQALLRSKSAECRRLFMDTGLRFKIVVGREVSSPSGFVLDGLRNVLLIA